MLTTISAIEEYLGVTLDSAETILYQQIIDAVDAYIEGVCDCHFTDALYSEMVRVSCGTLAVRNPVQFVYGFRMYAASAIKVTPPVDGVIAIDRPKAGGMTLRLIEGLTATEIDISAMTIAQVVAAINADSTWDAVIEDAAYGAKRAQFLVADMRQDEDGASFIYLSAFLTPVSLTQQTIRLFAAEGSCCGLGVIVYQGGFVTVPADLQDLATRMVIKAYSDRNPSTTVSGELKGEKIGDYEYQKLTASEISTSIGSLVVPYQSVLDKYRYFSI